MLGVIVYPRSRVPSAGDRKQRRARSRREAVNASVGTRGASSASAHVAPPQGPRTQADHLRSAGLQRNGRSPSPGEVPPLFNNRRAAPPSIGFRPESHRPQGDIVCVAVALGARSRIRPIAPASNPADGLVRRRSRATLCQILSWISSDCSRGDCKHRSENPRVGPRGD